uniref:Fic family protein n=1 Tax=Anaerococcus mediterraneensis TaxID=1870984 RepID=UPI0009300568|nr:Fic family protein [Anaerococcus mediterraneensis]
MDYIYKIYYKNYDKYNDEYIKRINNENTLKTNLEIKSINENYNLYFVPNIQTHIKLDKIRKNDKTLIELEQQLPPVIGESLLVDAISSELQSSNELEGVESKKEDIVFSTKKILSNNDTKEERFNSTINSYLLLINKALKIPKDSKDIRKIYDKITDGEIASDNLPDGFIFRKNDVHINKLGTVSGETIHKGIVGEDNIIEHIDNMLKFVNEANLPLLLKLAIGHYYFEYIHPFYDGNGRLGRFISSIYIESEYSYLTALSLSRGSYLEKAKYYKAFDVTNGQKNKGELNFFIDTFLEILIKGQEEMVENLIDKTQKINVLIDRINKDSNLDKDLDKKLLIGFLPNALFLFNSPISREEIIEKMSEDRHPVVQVKRSLNKLVDLKYLKIMKKRPITYSVEDSYL